jgi:hypothetical protein
MLVIAVIEKKQIARFAHGAFAAEPAAVLLDQARAVTKACWSPASVVQPLSSTPVPGAGQLPAAGGR